MPAHFNQISKTQLSQASTGPCDVHALLAPLRPPDAQPVPRDLLVCDAVDSGVELPGNHPFDQHVYAAAASMTFLEGRVIAFDLDDTLLNTNFICRESWNALPPALSHPAVMPSISYDKMRYPLSYWLKAGWRRPLRARYDSARYPFLRNPDVVAQLRPGVLALLHGLKEAGAVLVLVTLCARERLDFIFERLPLLRAAFVETASHAEYVLAAEDLAGMAHNWSTGALPKIPAGLDTDMIDDWKRAQRIHELKPGSFGLKTLLVLHVGLCLNRLDLLVDDSEGGHAAYSRAGMEQRFIKASRAEPYRPVALDWLREIRARLGDHSDADVAPEKMHEHIPEPEQYPWLRFEDPLYFPFIHMRDVLSTFPGKTL